MDQSGTGRTRIFSRWTNRAQNARVYSHDGGGRIWMTFSGDGAAGCVDDRADLAGGGHVLVLTARVLRDGVQAAADLQQGRRVGRGGHPLPDALRPTALRPPPLAGRAPYTHMTHR
eukprot:7759673-Pyramimonas_sp.AAC.1